MPEQIPSTEQVRVAMRTLHSCAPEAAQVVEAALDVCQQRVSMLSSDDAFRGYLLAKAQQDGAVLSLLQRIDSGILADLAKAEADRSSIDLIETQNRENKHLTVRKVLSEPVVLAVVGVVSTGMTGVLTLILQLLGD